MGSEARLPPTVGLNRKTLGIPNIRQSVATALFSQDYFEFNLVSKGDSLLSQYWDLRLQPPGLLERIRVDGGDVKPPLLIEPESTQIVVCGYEPEPFTASLACRVSHGVEK